MSDLHSFPTRRSSDLQTQRPCSVSQPLRISGFVRRSWCWRSEEHTSELQSRGHLVCRHLLEKKNSGDLRDLVAALTLRHPVYTGRHCRKWLPPFPCLG